MLLFDFSILLEQSILFFKLLVFIFKSFAFVRNLVLQALVRFVHFLDLVLEFGFECFHEHIVILLKFVLCACSTLLQLFKCDLELALRLNQVFLVILFLIFKELAFSFPKSFVFIIHRLQVGYLSFQLLLLALKFHHLLSLHVSIIECFTCTCVQVLNLTLILRDILLVILLHLSFFLFESCEFLL